MRVCDRLVELYLRGGLPVGGGDAAPLLDSYWLGRAERLPEDERRELYARVVGPGFEHLLGRLATALAADGGGEAAGGDAAVLGADGGEAAGDDAAVLGGDGREAAGGDDDLLWAADELRASVERHLDEDALAAIGQLRAQFGDALAILSDPELLNAYGARDPWHLVEQLARLELGASPDVDRHQTLASAGTLVIAWLAGEAQAAVAEEVADAARSWLAATA